MKYISNEELNEFSNSATNNLIVGLLGVTGNPYLVALGAIAVPGILLFLCAVRKYFHERKLSDFEKANICNAVCNVDLNGLSAPCDIDDDWFFAFVNIAKETSNKTKQLLLSRMLQNKLIDDKSFSYHTISVLKDLSEDDLIFFSSFSKYILDDFKDNYFIPNVEEIKNHINPAEFMRLEELGLIHPFGNIIIKSNLLSESNPVICSRFRMIIGKSLIKCERYADCGGAFLTKVGKEIFKIMDIDVEDCLELQLADFKRRLTNTEFLIVPKL